MHEATRPEVFQENPPWQNLDALFGQTWPRVTRHEYPAAHAVFLAERGKTSKVMRLRVLGSLNFHCDLVFAKNKVDLQLGGCAPVG
jgi:hypothetical protein